MNNSEQIDGFKLGCGALVVLFVVSLIGFFMFTTRIPTGQACVEKRFGKLISESPKPAGLEFRIPGVESYTCYSLRKRVYEVGIVPPAERTGSNADYKDFAQDARTKEGLDIQVAYVAQYHTDPNFVIELFRTGYRDQAAIDERAVKYNLRLIVPRVLSGYTNVEIYQGDLGYISQHIFNEVAPALASQGIILDSFGLKDRNFPDNYEAAIQEKSIKNEEIAAKVLAQELADAEAERLRREANGQAAAARIIAEGNANAAIEEGRGAAEKERQILETRARVLNENPVLVTWHNIDALYNADKVYLPSNILPIVPIEVPQPQKQ